MSKKKRQVPPAQSKVTPAVQVEIVVDQDATPSRLNEVLAAILLENARREVEAAAKNKGKRS
jgi:hypothetical protein